MSIKGNAKKKKRGRGDKQTQKKIIIQKNSQGQPSQGRSLERWGPTGSHGVPWGPGAKHNVYKCVAIFPLPTGYIGPSIGYTGKY